MDNATSEKNLHFLARWAKFFVENYKITLLLLIGFLVAGLWGLGNNQKQDFPSIPVNYIMVQARYIGATAVDVEREVINPVEATIDAMDIGVKSVRSTASNNFGYSLVELDEISGVDEKVGKLSEKITALTLPDGVVTEVSALDAIGPTVGFALYSDTLSKDDVLMHAPEVERYFEGLSPDIKRIDVSPNPETHINVELNPEAMARNHLAQSQVVGALQSYVTTLPGGIITTEDDTQRPITVVVPVQSIDDLRALSLGAVTLDDVADVERMVTDDEALTYAGFLVDGIPTSENAVYLLAYKTDDGDVTRIARALTEGAGQLYKKNIIPEEVKIEKVYDSSPFIEDQINTLVSNGLIGLVLILLVLLFFINLRTAIVVSLIIPLAFLITLFALPVFGFSINILTLFAMILTLGILVDNAIVIAEGIVFNLEKGAKKIDAVVTAVQELGPAVTVATLTTFVVFIPFASIGGIMGEFIKYIPYTVMIMVAGSYFLAITITPLFGKWLLHEETKEERRNRTLKSWQKYTVLPAIIHYGQKSVDHLVDTYVVFMQWLLSRFAYRITVLVLVVAAFFVSVFGFATRLKFEEFPANDSNFAVITSSFPTGISFAAKEEALKTIGEQILTLPYFESYFMFDNTYQILFTDPAKRTDDTTVHDIVDQLNEKLASIADTFPQGMYVNAAPQTYGPPSAEFDVMVEFVANDQDALAAATKKVQTYVEEQANVNRVSNSMEDGLVPSIDVVFNDTALQQQGVSPFFASSAVHSFFTRSEAGTVVLRADGASEKVYVNYPEASKNSIESVKNVLVPTVSGTLTTLASVADVQITERLESIGHLDGKRVATVSIDLAEGEDAAVFENSIRDFLTEEQLASVGLTKDDVVYGGFAATIAEDYSSLQLVFLLALLSVFIILVYQFRSYTQPLLIMSTIVMALIGIFPGLLLVGSSLNMVAGLGIVAVVGVVVNDAIVFIDYMNRFRKNHPELDFKDILVRTGEARFKPIFSTSITTIGGVLPITITDPFWTGLGTSIVAGLIFSTLGTLIVVPIIAYTLTTKKRRQPREN